MPESNLNFVPDELCGQLAAYFCDIFIPSGAKERDKIQFQNNRATDKVTLWLAYLGFLAQPAGMEGVGRKNLVVDANAMPDFAVESFNMTEADKQTLLDCIIRDAGDHSDLPVTRN